MKLVGTVYPACLPGLALLGRLTVDWWNFQGLF
jgi:hypothetical protein